MYDKLSCFKVKLTWLKEGYIPSFINYTPYYVFRQNRQGGGLAILVRNDVSVKEKNLILFPTGNLEVQAVTIVGRDSCLDVLNVYNPCFPIQEEEFSHYFSQMNNNCFIAGDFNAHNPLWDSLNRCNTAGNNLAEALLKFPNICLLTPLNSPTYYNIANRKPSTLDLCFVSDGFFFKFTN